MKERKGFDSSTPQRLGRPAARSFRGQDISYPYRRGNLAPTSISNREETVAYIRGWDLGGRIWVQSTVFIEFIEFIGFMEFKRSPMSNVESRESKTKTKSWWVRGVHRVRGVRGVHRVRRVGTPAQNPSEVASLGSSRKIAIASRSGAGRRVRNDYLLGLLSSWGSM